MVVTGGHHLPASREPPTGQPPANSGPFQVELDAFFLACWHMRDWMDGDNVRLPAITMKVIDEYVNKSLPLLRCRAYANTIKHFELNSPEKLAMRKVGHKSDEHSMSMSLEFWSSQTAQQVDALQLAEDCYAAWALFKQQHAAVRHRGGPAGGPGAEDGVRVQDAVRRGGGRRRARPVREARPGLTAGFPTGR